jgi:hypothetical protein
MARSSTLLQSLESPSRLTQNKRAKQMFKIIAAMRGEIKRDREESVKSY